MQRSVMRRAIFVALAALAVTIGAIVAVGYALPQNHTATRTTSLPSPPRDVFAAISQVDHYPRWRRDVQRVEVLGESPVRWREHSDGDTITFEVVESRPPERMKVHIADPDLPFGGTWTYELQPDGSGTHLTITEDGEVYNPVFRFMSRFVFGHGATLDRFIEALVAHLASRG